MSRPRTILVADDDPSIREVIALTLEEEGYRVLTARNGAEALDLVTRERPDLVLLDMRMPVLDGWGFAAALQARAIALDICVMTAAQNAHTWAKEVHACAYLAKPFELPDLLHIVEHGCG